MVNTMGLTRFFVRLIIGVLLIVIIRQCYKQLTKEDDDHQPPLFDISSSDVTGDKNELQRLKENTQLITISVYYEALCPDSKSFVIRQLQPTYQKLKDLVTIQLIPYGKAQTRIGLESPTFECQHGPKECEENMMHACAINVLTDQQLSVEFVTCMIKYNLHTQDIARKCGNELSVDPEPILKCATGTKGPILLQQYGHDTKSLKPPLEFVPTITLNNDRMYDTQAALLKDLLGEVCKLLIVKPAVCL